MGAQQSRAPSPCQASADLPGCAAFQSLCSRPFPGWVPTLSSGSRPPKVPVSPPLGSNSTPRPSDPRVLHHQCCRAGLSGTASSPHCPTTAHTSLDPPGLRTPRDSSAHPRLWASILGSMSPPGLWPWER